MRTLPGRLLAGLAASWPALVAAAPPQTAADGGAGGEDSRIALLLLAAGGLVVLIIIRRLLQRGAGPTSTGGQERSPRSGLGKRRLARRLLSQRRFVEAGELFLEAGQMSAALDAFLQGGASERAARLLESQGDLQQAAGAYETAGQHRDAARLWLRCGQPQAAARCQEADGQHGEAARLWTVAGEHVRAAEALRRKGDLREAARAFQRAGLFTRAGELYRQLWDGLRPLARTNPEQAAEMEELARLAARMFEAGGEGEQAIELYRQADLADEAVRLLVSAGRSPEAGRLLLDLGRTEEALPLLAQGADKTIVWRLEARQALAAGDLIGAAELLLKAGDKREAAAAFRDGRRLRDAARLFLAVDDPASAAQCLESAGETTAAALAHEQAGNLVRAEELFRQLGQRTDRLRVLRALGDALNLGRALLEQGEPLAAEAALETVPRTHAEFRAAALLLAGIRRDRKEWAAAVAKYRQALAGVVPAADNLDQFHALALVSLQAGDEELASSALEAILELNPDYPGARERLERLQHPAPQRDAVRLPSGPLLELTEVAEPEDDRAMTLRRLPAELARATDATLPGGRAPRYQLLEPIGRGGLSEVFRARDLLLDREVAYKKFTTIHSVPGATPAAFLHEARAAARLHHMNIVTVFDAGEEAGTPYLAMELVDGEDLSAMVADRGALGIRFISTLLRQCCEALAYAHERGVIHRDVKPANMMWTCEGTLKITDFGLARFVNESSPETQSQVMGTPFYMSPEQILGEALDPRTDIYSIGATFFELTCGRAPFVEGKIIEQHLHASPPLPSSLRPDCPAWLDRAILWCLRKEPNRRPPSVRELWKTVQKDLESAG